MKKLLYLSDLYNFYVSQNKNVKFSSKDADTTIVVHIDEPFTYSANEDDDLNLYCPIRLCHTEQNVNQSFISETAMKDAIETAYEMPILGRADRRTRRSVCDRHADLKHDGGDVYHAEISPV